MKLTKLEAETKFPNVIFLGELFWIGRGARVGQDARVEQGARVEQDARVGRGAIVGRNARVEQGARVGQDAIVEQGARVGRGAIVERDARVAAIINKYICNISPLQKSVNIRLGCELHSIPEWEELKEKIADKNDRQWWDESGQFIYEFLKQEAERYTLRYQK